DHEIFDLVSELEANEGWQGTTFYSFLGVDSTASVADISKAYRKKSVLLHPDKNPGIKGIHERFSRLGVISSILRNEESRKRYDFFYKNGVPKWRGTGYYYSRFRPGLGTVIIFLIILTSSLQYLVQRMNYKRDLARIQHFVTKARLAAWGPKLIRIETRRKVKVNVGSYSEDDSDEQPSRSKWLDMVVEGDKVYILESGGQLLLLDDTAATAPSFKRTWFLGLVILLHNKLREYRSPASSEAVDAKNIDYDDTESSSDIQSGNESRKASYGGELRAQKIGGSRRKAAKRR
ncbi:DnaJ domain-containing protein, partial [Hysterangium stoloniferum]